MNALDLLAHLRRRSAGTRPDDHVAADTSPTKPDEGPRPTLPTPTPPAASQPPPIGQAWPSPRTGRTPMPERIQRRRVKGWRKPENAVYVGRPTKWGNPYRWTNYQDVGHDYEGEPYAISVAARRRFAVVDFTSVVKYGIGSFDYPNKDEIRRELAGKDLICWCPPGQPCHADVLLAIANEGADCG